MTNLTKFLNELNKFSSIHIVGTSGTEGSEIATFLAKHKIPNVVLHDYSADFEHYQKSFNNSHYGYSENSRQKKWEALSESDYKLNLSDNYLSGIESADLIFVPQSWYLYKQNAKLKDLKAHIKFSSLTRLYLELLPCIVIGITGSSGKSTTSALTHHLLSQDTSRQVYLAGNDRSSEQLLLKLEEISPNDIVVSEISNRQLVDTEGVSPHIAVVTNISENHLSEHDSYDEYIELKSRIFKYQKPTDHVILNNENEICLSFEKIAPSKILWFNNAKSPASESSFTNDSLAIKGYKSFKLSNFKPTGTHNRQNLAAAGLVAKICGLSPEQIQAGIDSFVPLTGRLETICIRDGLTFINDRQGTAVASTIAAIKNTTAPLTLIFGGINKGMPIDELCSLINSKNILPIGIESPFVSEVSTHLPNLLCVKTLTDAVKSAIEKTPRPGTILFSPACEYGPYFNPLPGHEDAEFFVKLVTNPNTQQIT